MKKAGHSKAEVEKKVARILAQARRDPRFQAPRERRALIDAIRYGWLEIAHLLLAQGVDPNSTDGKRRSALWYAAHLFGRSELIKDLVRRGARLPDDVLMGPVHDGDSETVKLLIRHGANVNCVATFTRFSYKFPKKQVLLTVAMEKVRQDQVIRRSERTSGLGLTVEERAALPLDPPRTKLEAIPLMLIKAGAQVNRLAWEFSLCEGYRRTLLGLAAHFGHVKTVRAMLAAGANVNLKDTWGGTALLDAAKAGHRKIVKILLEAGANVNLKRKDGLTAASAAREHGFRDIADQIERHGKRA